MDKKSSQKRENIRNPQVARKQKTHQLVKQLNLHFHGLNMKDNENLMKNGQINTYVSKLLIRKKLNV